MTKVRYGQAARPIAGERQSGDHILVIDRGEALFCAVIDGLGHGPQAAAAAKCASDFLESHSDLPFDRLLRECDQAIAHTRGAAITALRITSSSETRLEHIAVGNVEVAAVSREPIHPIARGGVVGGRFRKAVTTSYNLHPGDLLAVHTDGVSGRFRLAELRGISPDVLARRILEEYGRQSDDASCLVIELQ